MNQSGLECSEKSCSAQKRWETGPRRSYIRASRTNASHLALLCTPSLPRLCRLRHGQRQRAMKGNNQVRWDNPSQGTILAVVVLHDYCKRVQDHGQIWKPSPGMQMTTKQKSAHKPHPDHSFKTR
jgi:hypothetical protein